MSWTEVNTLMNILDVDIQAHVHEAARAAKWRAEDRATRKSR